MLSDDAVADPSLLQLHPLLSRLSGQVVWCLLEERGVEPDAVHAFMDGFEALKRETSLLLEKLMQAKESIVLRIKPVVELEAYPLCPDCLLFSGMHLCIGPDEKEAALRFLPPFGLGCPLRAEIVEGCDPTSVPHMERLDLSTATPTVRLHCDSDRIFTAPELGP